VTYADPIEVGDRVRSYDFAHVGQRDLFGPQSDYIEGIVETIDEWMEGCPRYKITVERQISSGREEISQVH